MNVPKLVRKKLSEVLVDEKIVHEDMMAEALNRQKESGDPLPVVLQKMGTLPEYELARAICKQYNLPFIDASRYKIPRDMVSVIPLSEMEQGQFVVLDKVGKALLLAISNVPAMDKLEELERKTGSQIFLFVSTLGQVAAALKILENPAVKPGAAPAPPKAAAASSPGAKPGEPARPTLQAPVSAPKPAGPALSQAAAAPPKANLQQVEEALTRLRRPSTQS